MPAKLLKTIAFLVVFLVAGVVSASEKQAFAASSSDSCLGTYGIDYVGPGIANTYDTSTTEVPFTVSGPNFISGKTYQLFVRYETEGSNPTEIIDSQVANAGKISFTLKGANTFSISSSGTIGPAKKNKTVYIGESGSPFCRLKKYSVKSVAKCTFSFDQVVENTTCLDESGGKVTVRVTDIASSTGIYSGDVSLSVRYSSTWWLDGGSDAYTLTTNPPGSVHQSFDVFKNRTFKVVLAIPYVGECETSEKTVVQTCSDEARTNGRSLGEVIDPSKEIEVIPFQLCDQITDSALQQKCIDCAGGDDHDAAGIWTASDVSTESPLRS